MISTNTLIRFKIEAERSDQGDGYNLVAELEEAPGRDWNCHLGVKQSPAKTELSIEASPSKLNKVFSGERVPLFFYDVYHSRLQPARRNETAQNQRVDLMVVSRTSLPHTAFHNLGRTNVAHDAMAAWLTNIVSEHLQKVLKTGFVFSGVPKSGAQLPGRAANAT